MEQVDVAVRDLDEVQAEVMVILDRRRDEIDDDSLDGSFWFLALLAEARSALRRRRSVSLRRFTGI